MDDSMMDDGCLQRSDGRFMSSGITRERIESSHSNATRMPPALAISPRRQDPADSAAIDAISEENRFSCSLVKDSASC